VLADAQLPIKDDQTPKREYGIAENQRGVGTVDKKPFSDLESMGQML
jgi:hypothetical protein